MGLACKEDRADIGPASRDGDAYRPAASEACCLGESRAWWEDRAATGAESRCVATIDCSNILRLGDSRVGLLGSRWPAWTCSEDPWPELAGSLADALGLTGASDFTHRAPTAEPVTTAGALTIRETVPDGG